MDFEEFSGEKGITVETDQYDRGETFIDIVLSWTLDDWANEKLLELQQIPTVFESEDQWCNAISPFVIEEMRAKLCAHLQSKCTKSVKSPCSLLRCMSSWYLLLPEAENFKRDVWSAKHCMTLALLSRVENSKKFIGESSNFATVLIYNCLDEKDRRLLPEQVNKWIDEENKKSFLVELKLPVDTKASPFLRTILPVTRENDPVFYSRSNELQVTFLCETVIPSMRIYSSLCARRFSGNIVVDSILTNDRKFVKNPIFHDVARDAACLDEIYNYSRKTLNLDDFQITSIKNVLTTENDFSPLQIIRGPPGTGKSSTLVGILWALYQLNIKVHITAPTNAAVRELLVRFKDVFESQSEHLGFFRKRRHANVIFVGRVDPSNTSANTNIQGSPDPSDMDVDTEVHAEDDADDEVWRCENAGKSYKYVSGTARYELQHRLNRLNQVGQVIDRTCGNLHQLIVKNFGYTEEDITDCSLLTKTVSERDEHQCTNVLVLEHMVNLFQQVYDCLDLCLWELPSVSFSPDRKEADHKMQLMQHQLEMVCKKQLANLRTVQLSVANVPSPSNQQEVVLIQLREIHNQSQSLLNELRQTKLYVNLPTAQSKVGISSLRPADLIHEASFIFSTVNGGGKAMLRKKAFDVVIVDEAAQLVEAEIAILLKPRLKCLVLAGDDKQLPATVFSQQSRRNRYGESLMRRLITQGYYFHKLLIQYRMHPNISRWPNDSFYDGELIDGPNVSSEEFSKTWHNFFPPFSVFAVQSKDTYDGASYFNSAENDVVRRIVTQIRNTRDAFNQNRVTIGIISPYSAQISLLKELEKEISYNNTSPAMTRTEINIRVSTVDGFQGQECDIIIFSAVRSNKHGAIGFVQDDRRLNVAITRAKFCLMIVCHPETLSMNNKTWTSLLKYARDNSYIFASDQQPTMVNRKAVQIIQRVEERVNQIDLRFAALQNTDDLLFENSAWNVFFTKDFQDSINEHCDIKTKSRLFKRLLEYADGARPKFMYSFCNNAVPLECRDIISVLRFEVKLFIIVTVEVDVYKRKQVLKFWRIVRLVKCEDAVKRVARSLERYSSLYLEMCKRVKENGKGKKLPVVFSLGEIEELKQSLSNRAKGGLTDLDGDKVVATDNAHTKNAVSLMKLYEMSSNVARCLLFHDNYDNIELPFVMSIEEEAMVRNKQSMFILGRSGTGKTTILLHKMFLHNVSQMKQAKTIGKNDTEAIGTANAASAALTDSTSFSCRQLLVTASPVLCEAIRNSYASMIKSAGNLSMQEEDKSDKYESKISVGTTVFEAPTGSMVSLASTAGMDSSFCNLPEDSPPLFMTYEGFLQGLNASVSQPFQFLNTMTTKNRLVVNFRRFQHHYYPHFNEDDKGFLKSDSLFREIMTCIKGSAVAVKSETGCLSEAEYVILAESRSSSFSSSDRHIIYNLYTQYEKMKKQLNEYDQLDVIHHIYHQLQQGRVIRQTKHLDFVYIDEVQDLVPAQIMLFKFICRNPRGFVFAGDTAQTIAEGVGFRFNTIKDLFYEEFYSEIYPASSVEARSQIVPKISYLSENFRTHRGIVGVANSIVSLLVSIFPHTIDKLPDEVSRIEGPLPVLVRSTDVQLDSIINESLGADQAILVRDDAAKEEAMRVLGCKAIVLTVLEAKGMEFVDCIVYNFFANSPFERDWRVIYNWVDSSSKPRPEFDDHRHSHLCSELKKLYVLVTRAKQNLVILDTLAQNRDPMMDYWDSKALVTIAEEYNEGVRSIFSSSQSSLADWKNRADQFFGRKQYANARMCYDRAGEERNSRHCVAKEKQAKAEDIIVVDKVEAQKLFKAAALLYMDLGMTLECAVCHEKAEDFVNAAAVYLQCQDRLSAARCLEACDCFSEAAEEYAYMNHVSDCLRCYFHMHDYTEAQAKLDLFIINGVLTMEENAKLKQDCLFRAAAYFHEKNDVTSMMECVHQMQNIQDKRDFLCKMDRIDQLLDVEVAFRNYDKAAKIYEVREDWQQASIMYHQAGQRAMVYRTTLRYFRREGGKRAISRFVHARPSKDVIEKHLQGVSSCISALAHVTNVDPMYVIALKFKDIQQFESNEVVLSSTADEDFSVSLMSFSSITTSIAAKLDAVLFCLQLKYRKLHADILSSAHDIPKVGSVTNVKKNRQKSSSAKPATVSVVNAKNAEQKATHFFDHRIFDEFRCVWLELRSLLHNVFTTKLSCSYSAHDLYKTSVVLLEYFELYPTNLAGLKEAAFAGYDFAMQYSLEGCSADSWKRYFLGSKASAATTTLTEVVHQVKKYFDVMAQDEVRHVANDFLPAGVDPELLLTQYALNDNIGSYYARLRLVPPPSPSPSPSPFPPPPPLTAATSDVADTIFTNTSADHMVASGVSSSLCRFMRDLVTVADYVDDFTAGSFSDGESKRSMCEKVLGSIITYPFHCLIPWKDSQWIYNSFIIDDKVQTRLLRNYHNNLNYDSLLHFDTCATFLRYVCHLRKPMSGHLLSKVILEFKTRLKNEYDRKKNHSDAKLTDPRLKLFIATMWEFTSNTAPKQPPGGVSPLYHSTILVNEALNDNVCHLDFVDVLKDLAERRVHPQQCKYSLQTHLKKLGCFSPLTMISLMKRQLVYTSLYTKGFKQVVLTKSLAREVLCNTYLHTDSALVDEIRRIQQQTGNEAIISAGHRMNEYAKNLLYKLCSTINLLSVELFQLWCDISDPTQKLTDRYHCTVDDIMHYFTEQLVIVISTLILSHYSSDYMRSHVSQIVANLHNLANNSPDGLPKDHSSIFRYAPLHVSRYLKAVTAKNIFFEFAKFLSHKKCPLPSTNRTTATVADDDDDDDLLVAVSARDDFTLNLDKRIVAAGVKTQLVLDYCEKAASEELTTDGTTATVMMNRFTFLRPPHSVNSSSSVSTKIAATAASSAELSPAAATQICTPPPPPPVPTSPSTTTSPNKADNASLVGQLSPPTMQPADESAKSEKSIAIMNVTAQDEDDRNDSLQGGVEELALCDDVVSEEEQDEEVEIDNNKEQSQSRNKQNMSKGKAKKKKTTAGGKKRK